MGRIDTLLAAMTIEEKIGQLNMVPAGRTVTGPGELRDVHEGIRTGRIGGLLNLWGPMRRAPSSVSLSKNPASASPSCWAST